MLDDKFWELKTAFSHTDNPSNARSYTAQMLWVG